MLKILSFLLYNYRELFYKLFPHIDGYIFTITEIFSIKLIEKLSRRHFINAFDISEVLYVIEHLKKLMS